jgi:hypothetical protein
MQVLYRASSLCCLGPFVWSNGKLRWGNVDVAMGCDALASRFFQQGLRGRPEVNDCKGIFVNVSVKVCNVGLSNGS